MSRSATLVALCLGLLALPAPAEDAGNPPNACGAEMASSAPVPEKLAELFGGVAKAMRGHADWVGTATPEAKAEHDALLEIAADYQAIADDALKAAAAMRLMKKLKDAPHDPARFDAKTHIKWLEEKVRLQRAFAELLLQHAKDSEAVIARIKNER